MISNSQFRTLPKSRRQPLIPRIVSLVLALLSFDAIVFAAPARAESEASSEAGLEANFTPRGRRGRGRYYQQQQQANPALWNQQSQQQQQALWNQQQQQQQQGRNQLRQQRAHPVVRNYGGGRGQQGQQQSGQSQNFQNQQWNQQSNQQSNPRQPGQTNP
jgi:hypothetical protein